MKIKFYLITLFLFLVSCTNSKELGSKDNPLKFYLIPAQDILALQSAGKDMQKFLEKELQISVIVEIPTSYITVVESFGSKRADAAILNTYGYVLAHQKYDVVPRLKLLNRGREHYFGQIIARADGPKKLEDLNNKKFAFVDPVSSSGYLFPLHLINDKKIKFKEQIFAGTHDAVVTAVYQKKVDAGATFYAPPDPDGTPKDARWVVRTQFPDVFEKIKVLAMTDPIPNDPVVFRKDVPQELQDKVVAALKKYIQTEEGKKNLMAMYHITDFTTASDADYEIVRRYIKETGQDVESFLKEEKKK